MTRYYFQFSKLPPELAPFKSLPEDLRIRCATDYYNGEDDIVYFFTENKKKEFIQKVKHVIMEWWEYECP